MIMIIIIYIYIYLYYIYIIHIYIYIYVYFEFPTRPVTCILGTGMVTSVTGNQSLEPEPGTTVQDKFEYIL